MAKTRLGPRKKTLPSRLVIRVTDELWEDIERAKRATGICATSDLVRNAVKRLAAMPVEP